MAGAPVRREGGAEATPRRRLNMEADGSAFAELVFRTPLVRSAPLSERLGSEVWLKLESLQRTGSFKLRGAAMRLDALDADERRRGVVAASAGNHGQGVALAGRVLGVPVEVVVPERTPRVKRAGMEAHGARVVVAGAGYDEAEAIARKRAAHRGAVFVSPFDDPLVILGNGGTVAEEILDELPGVGQVVCPVGGGGLVAGLAEALAPLGIAVLGAQPEANCAMHESLRLGRALLRYEGRPTLAEGCEGGVAERTFEICRDHGVVTATVSEEAIARAMVYAYRVLGLVVEASAAVAIAAVLEGRLRLAARAPTVIVVSGSNVEPELLDRLLKRT